ncbi:MAG: response regulator [Halovenus sp.]
MAGSIRVLAVDEDPDVLELTETFLRRASDRIAVETETSASAALDRVAEGEVDCVVSDFRMPAMDGLELFEAIRETDPDIPFFLFTAAADRETSEAALSAGVTGFVRKGSGTEHYEELADLITDAVG